MVEIIMLYNHLCQFYLCKKNSDADLKGIKIYIHIVQKNRIIFIMLYFLIEKNAILILTKVEFDYEQST